MVRMMVEIHDDFTFFILAFSLIFREMSYESFSKMVECSHKMIDKVQEEVQNHFVPRNELNLLTKKGI